MRGLTLTMMLAAALGPWAGPVASVQAELDAASEYLVRWSTVDKTDATALTAVDRRVHYFANIDPDDTLEVTTADCVVGTSSMDVVRVGSACRRASDGVLVACAEGLYRVGTGGHGVRNRAQVQNG